MNNLVGIYTIWYRDLLRFWHNKMRFIGSVSLPLLLLVVFGSGLSPHMGALAPGVDFTRFIFPGIIGMTVIMGSFMSGVSVVWDREFGFLKEVLVAPISRASVVIGKTLGGASIASLQGMILLILSPLIGASLSPGRILALVPLIFLLATAMGSLGILLATRINSMEAFQAVMQMLMFPMVFLAGIFSPPQGSPVWLTTLMKLNPASYGVSAVRQVVLGTSAESPFAITVLGHTMSLWDDVAVLVIFGTATILLSIWSFRHQG
jgi:ABC-2 type transport system permease protein